MNTRRRRRIYRAPTFKTEKISLSTCCYIEIKHNFSCPHCGEPCTDYLAPKYKEVSKGCYRIIEHKLKTRKVLTEKTILKED